MEQQQYDPVAMVTEFMSNWQSQAFRDRIVAQISEAKESYHPDPNSEDQVEKFVAEKTSSELEKFVFEKSKQREDYLSLVADLLLHIRRARGEPGQGREHMNGATPNGDHPA